MLLFEEFFRKISELGKGSIIIYLVIRMIYIVLIFGIFILIGYSVMTGRNGLLVILLILFILAEASHFIRKKREKAMREKKANEDIEKGRENILKTEKSKNNYLLDSGKEKNKGLLKAGKDKKHEIGS